MKRLGRTTIVAAAVAFAVAGLVRPTGAGDDEEKKLVPADEVEQAFDTLRRAVGERAGREGALTGGAEDAPKSKGAVSQPALATQFSDMQLEGLLQSKREDVRILEAGLLQYRDAKSELVLVRNHRESGVQFRYARTGGKWTLEAMNRWNQEKRLTKAYLDQDLDPTLEMDVVVAGGLTLDTIREALELFDYSVTAFRDHLKQTNEKK